MKLFIVLIFITLLNGENLTHKYKQMMSSNTPTQTEPEVVAPVVGEKKNSLISNNQNMIEEIKQIQALKQDTFESTSDFTHRIEQELLALKNKVQFFSQNGSKEYSVGTTTMESYDADKEMMKLTLNWDNGLKSLFPDIKNLKTVLLSIVKDEAKMLFSKKKTHFFHIDVAYMNKKFRISKLTLNNKYTMQKLQRTTKPTVQPSKRITTSKKSTVPILPKYDDNENITLDQFLHKFYKVGEENLASKVLPYYAYRVDRYFSMKNVTKNDILRDKKQYYKRWVKRKYHLLQYEILNTSYTDRAILYIVKTTIDWEVRSAKGKEKHGTSTKTIHLYHDYHGIVVTSIQ